MSSQLLYFYISKQLNISFEEAKQKYCSLCFYKQQSPANIKYRKLQKEKEEENKTIDIHSIQEEKKKIELANNDLYQKQQQLKRDIKKISDKKEIDKLEKKMIELQSKYDKNLQKFNSELLPLEKKYNENLHFINNLPKEYQPDDNYIKILIWETEDVKKPSQKLLISLEEQYIEYKTQKELQVQKKNLLAQGIQNYEKYKRFVKIVLLKNNQIFQTILGDIDIILLIKKLQSIYESSKQTGNKRVNLDFVNAVNNNYLYVIVKDIEFLQTIINKYTFDNTKKTAYYIKNKQEKDDLIKKASTIQELQSIDTQLARVTIEIDIDNLEELRDINGENIL